MFFERVGLCDVVLIEDGNKVMKYIEFCVVVLDVLEKYDIGVMFFDGCFVVFDEVDFLVVVVYFIGVEYMGEELDSDIWQVELYIEVFLFVQVLDLELDVWMEFWIYLVMSDILVLLDLIISMVVSGYDYWCDDDVGLWSLVDLIYVIIYEM